MHMRDMWEIYLHMGGMWEIYVHMGALLVGRQDICVHGRPSCTVQTLRGYGAAHLPYATCWTCLDRIHPPECLHFSLKFCLHLPIRLVELLLDFVAVSNQDCLGMSARSPPRTLVRRRRWRSRGVQLVFFSGDLSASQRHMVHVMLRRALPRG